MNGFEDLRARLAALDQRQLRRTRRIVEGEWTPTARLAEPGATGRAVLAFCSNDYLGLASHPAVVEALAAGARRFGAGSGASPLISGHNAVHHDLEARFAATQSAHIPTARALHFGTGYLANLAVISALADRETEVFSEELNHASLIDGIRLAYARRRVYPHADADALEAMLQASTARRRVIVTDAVFSMDGDLAPLSRLLALAERHDAWLVIDDAHGFGVLGPGGRGSLAHFGLRSDRILYMATLGKAMGVGGALVCAQEDVIEWLIQRARPYIYSTAAPPALAAAVAAAFDIALGAEGEALRATLRAHVARLQAGFPGSSPPGAAQAAALQGGAGGPGGIWRLLSSPTPIQPIVVGGNEAALALAAALLDRGIWVPAIRPPTVPEGTARLRVTLSAAHTAEQVDRLTRVLRELAARPG
ncbi:8-amino-7-oxononanoate synthase [Burkholderiales bacterium GJ-E10]|nr:8-amino-7-oxononanoate synthase [Burkholderiales bacterium GJ-E10]